MNTDSQSDSLPLAEALIEWSDAALVDVIRREERKADPAQIQEYRRWTLAGLREELRTPQPSAPLYPPLVSLLGLDRAWDRLIGAFKLSLQRGTFVLTGAYTKHGGHQRQVIPAGIAANLNIDAPSGSVFVGAVTPFYTAVTVWRAGVTLTDIVAASAMPEAIAATAASDRPLPPITDANVRALTDDEVFLLLEDHARRVVESPDAKLIAAGKISLMPIIRRKMLHRHNTGAMEDTLITETTVLANWIATKVPSHQAPTAGSIKNALRNEYQVLKA